ncbi:MAG: histidine phosphatase family protein [Nanoarchaeota archaeon]|nr:histidine phosphatase family protein [Nanoarchaeota archaeon]
MTRIILIRHCKTEGNASGKMQGYYDDSSFTEEGLTQLRKLERYLSKEPIKAIYCSDLGRALKTAEAIAKLHNLKVSPLKDLREANIGIWRYLPVKESIDKWIEYYKAEKAKGIPREKIRPPEGENAWDHQKRVLKAIKKIIKDYPNNTVVIVGHAGTNKVLIGTFESRDPDDFYSIPQDNACINIIETDGVKYKVIKINDTHFLK